MTYTIIVACLLYHSIYFFTARDCTLSTATKASATATAATKATTAEASYTATARGC